MLIFLVPPEYRGYLTGKPKIKNIDPTDAYSELHFRINALKMTSEFGAKYNTIPALKKEFGEDALPTNRPGQTLTEFERLERAKEQKIFNQGVQDNTNMIISEYDNVLIVCTNFCFSVLEPLQQRPIPWHSGSIIQKP